MAPSHASPPARAGRPTRRATRRNRSSALYRNVRFTALLHHVTLEKLRESYERLNPRAAPGVDGVTWEEYGRDLENRLRDLHSRLHRGAYRARPSRRAYIPKADGRFRPLSIAAVEDKIVQAAVAEVLNAIYEVDFLGFSYGFRPGRSPHHALDALTIAIRRKKVSWVLDADIRGFFDAIDHSWLLKFVKHRIGDVRILRLIQKWLTAGVMEKGTKVYSEVGTPQGATISPALGEHLPPLHLGPMDPPLETKARTGRRRHRALRGRLRGWVPALQ